MILRCSGCSAGLMVSSGNRIEAKKMLDQLKELSKQRYVAAYSFALVYLGLGDKNEALHWLEQSYQDRAGSDIGWIRVDPLLDRLRGDPRFEALAEKIVPAGRVRQRHRRLQSEPNEWIHAELFGLPLGICALLAGWTKPRWLQWVGVGGLFVQNISYFVFFIFGS